jgi:hypothetical protein
VSARAPVGSRAFWPLAVPAAAGQVRIVALGVLLPLVTFSLGFFALAWADWDRGVQRALMLGGLLALLAAFRERESRPLPGLWSALAAALGLLCAWRLVQAGAVVLDARMPTVDIGQTTIQAVELWARGLSPYQLFIDRLGARENPGGTGFHFYGGFKYGPMMIWAYAPGVLGAGVAGYYATTAVAFGLMAAAAGLWAADRDGSGGSPAAGLGAALLVLVPGFVHQELFQAGVNDAVPVALGVLAFAARSRSRPLLSAVLIGASVGAKLLPGLLLAVPLLLAPPAADARAGRGERWQALAVAAGVAVACYLPSLLTSPRELIAGLVLFQLSRRPDSTSLAFFLPPDARLVLSGVTALAIGFLLWRHLRSPRPATPATTAALVSRTLVLLFLGSGIVHRNYLLWVLPFLAVATAGYLWGPLGRVRGHRRGA